MVPVKFRFGQNRDFWRYFHQWLWGGGRHPDPEKSGRARSQKNFFPPFGPRFDLKIRGKAGAPALRLVPPLFIAVGRRTKGSCPRQPWILDSVDAPSLRCWRYCEMKVLAAEPRSKKRSGDEAFEIFLAAPSNLTRPYFKGSAAKSHSTATQYRQLRRLGCPTPGSNPLVGFQIS